MKKSINDITNCTTLDEIYAELVDNTRWIATIKKYNRAWVQTYLPYNRLQNLSKLSTETDTFAVAVDIVYEVSRRIKEYEELEYMNAYLLGKELNKPELVHFYNLCGMKINGRAYSVDTLHDIFYDVFFDNIHKCHTDYLEVYSDVVDLTLAEIIENELLKHGFQKLSGRKTRVDVKRKLHEHRLVQERRRTRAHKHKKNIRLNVRAMF